MYRFIIRIFRYKKALKKNPFTDPVRADQFLNWIHKYENIIECSDSWDQISAAGMLEYHLCDGDPILHWKGRGYKTLFDLLMVNVSKLSRQDFINFVKHKNISCSQCKLPSPTNELPVLDKIHFNKTVSSINYHNDNKIIVKTTDESQYETDHVIFTGSLGVLKEHHRALFTPSLPELKQRAIQVIIELQFTL